MHSPQNSLLVSFGTTYINTYQYNIVGGNGLQDNNANCPRWANRGECTKNSNYMLVNCKKSCAGHQGGNTGSTKYK